MNEFEQQVLERAKEWFHARQAANLGSPINWTDFNADALEEAVGALIESEIEEEKETILVFVCF